MLGLLAIMVIVLVALSSNYQSNQDYTYRFNGQGHPYTFWDDDGDYGEGSAPFLNEIDREENW